ncbi:MAG: GIY-YIG nuclease family protein [Maribacter sp.]|nr:GIY-YIG nuclease family protein [Maribacter sp.]
MEPKGAYVYILTNDRGNVFYIGSTESIKERMYFHRQRLIPGFTKKYNVTQLVYFEMLPDLETAQLREKYLKGKTRKKKNLLVEAMNPSYKDLTPSL